jgi:predicted GNAT family N-acyltransferase
MKLQTLPIEVIRTTWQEDEVTLRALREEVFIKEQQVTPDLEWDEHDETATHFLAFNDKHEPVGTARLMTTGQLGRMAVLANYRKQGFGSALLRKAIKEAQKQNLTEVVLYAQTHALPFYEKFGFTAYGDEFMDAEIPHRRMRLSITPLHQDTILTQKGLPDLNNTNTFILGETKISYLLESSQEFNTALCHLIRQAKLNIRILSNDLDHLLFDNEQFVAGVSSLLCNNTRATFKMLIHNTESLRERAHLLVPLAQRLTTPLEIKKCDPKYASPGAVYVIIDETGLLYRPSFETYNGFANANYPRKCKELIHTFDYLWEHALPETDMRTFTL